MQIPRSLATAIMTQALRNPAAMLLGVIDNDDHSLHFAVDEAAMLDLEQSRADHIRLCNQHPVAQQFTDTHALADGVGMIEVFQDTEGVFGLRAYLQQGKMLTPVALEFEESV